MTYETLIKLTDRAAWQGQGSKVVVMASYKPWASTPAARSVMQGNRSRDTKPELALRSAVYALGLRYRVGTRPLADVRSTADLVFRPAKVAVFVDGCFWHGCPEHRRPLTVNADYWTAKINRNQQRDAKVDALLRAAEWLPVRVWEHEPVDAAAQHIVDIVQSRRASRSVGS